ncbi:uncharacterized protein LOC125071577 [Vanessa atalanta]|uniref:uncharacterized protein LOC125071577 n=1 Tax=Vanessa atalanta TaxID=42275 RepID=UPI001FCE141A|nr:uncharacterized protein LOC125071577 [Vanessa atalanta]
MPQADLPPPSTFCLFLWNGSGPPKSSLTIGTKVFCKIILDRLSKAVESLLRKEQAGFRRNCSTQSGLIPDDVAVHAGVRQGCVLSPLLFLVNLDGIMLRILEHRCRGIEWGLSNVFEDLDYTDDLCLLSHTQADMQAKLNDLKVVERVHKFTYLGSVVSETGGSEEVIASRIAKARATYAQLRPVWQSQKLTRRIKLKIFGPNVKSVLLYGCETWKVTKDISRLIQVFVNRCLRRILGIYWPETISNLELLEKCHESPIDSQIKRRKWRWIGHTLRRDPDHIPKQALYWNPQGKRKRGHSRQTWRRSVLAEAASIGMTWSEVKAEAQDRSRCRTSVDVLCPI